MIDGQNIFDQPVKNKLRTYDNIRKIVTGQRDDYTTGSIYNIIYYWRSETTALDLSQGTMKVL